MIQKLLSIGSQDGDSEIIKQRKTFVVAMGAVMGMGGIVWGAICETYGYNFAASIPFGYTVITVFNLIYFNATKNFKVTAFIQVFISLMLPFLLQWALGGFISSGAVMLWSVLSVIGSLAVYSTKQSIYWVILFAVLTIFSWWLEPHLVEYRIDAPRWVNTMFFVINILIINISVYFLVVYFINSRDEKMKEIEQKHLELEQSQSQLVQSEKLAALGQLIAGVAHEVNTPLGAIQASVGTIRSAIKTSVKSFPEVFEKLNDEEKASFFIMLQAGFDSKVSLSSSEERQARRKLTTALDELDIEDADEVAEMMIDIGIIEVAESYLPIIKSENSLQYLDLIYNQTEQCKNSDNIQTAVDRASKIVFALKNYSRFDHSGEKIPTNLGNNIDTVLTLYHNMIKRGVTVEKDFDIVADIECFPDELNQVWTNLIHNAIQAMNGEGTLKISLRKEGNELAVRIADSGSGIPEEIKSRIFEPFFTTKKAGEGSGLGLDIVRKIIEKHGGTISVESEPGNTEFTVKLPY
ncbi:MAG: GHKL domain-containing protein [Crocinitomicaceae bacterium]|nr:GHKL domain-containing protein [Crocinitomicaceae bacterium]